MYDVDATIAPVMVALDELAEDDSLALADYIDALEVLASSIDVRLEAARLDLGRTT